MRKILTLPSAATAGLLFVPPLFQMLTGIGLVIDGFVVGFLPSEILYLLWLLLLTAEFRIPSGRGLRQILELGFTLIAIIPLQWYLVNLVGKEANEEGILLPIGEYSGPL